ncbi:MAG: 3-hydroxyacyl-CoA dehydrogenase NAD-binding domain-containing protein [Alphaproteobacteria bacterium]|nr:3-hydroxyacyl-CoA dehydrogenase NAD-binding domain-containing protein [Alphaproteobacteria bacterium]
MPGPAPEEIRTIGIIGAGTIGASWAALFLARGKRVAAWDPAEGAEAKMRAFVARAWPALETLGLIAPAADPEAIDFMHSPAAVAAEADFIQESAPERLDLKLDLLADFTPAARPDIVISSSTSGLLISDLQQACAHPERFVLGHPFNPPHLIPLVEVLGGAMTDPAWVDWTVSFYNKMEKRAIRINKEVPGHVANRMQAAIWREAIHLAMEGVASVEDIDAAIAYGPGLRWALMGPHLTFHLAGGEGGIENFLEHLGPPTASWWEDLGAPQLNDSVKQTLIAGVMAEVKGRSVPDLVARRDARLLALLKTLRESDGE